MRTRKILAFPLFLAMTLALLLNFILQVNVNAMEPPCPSNILAVAHHVGGWEDETRWITPTWEGGAWAFSSTVPASLTVPHLGKEDWIDYWNNGELRIASGTISTTHASYTCVAPDWDTTPEAPTTPEVPEEPEQPEEPAGPNTNQRPACDKDCLPCPDSLEKVAELVSGGQGNWMAPEGEWGAWRFTASEPMTLTVPERGYFDWLDYWHTSAVSTSLGSIFVSEASYTCKPLTVESPEQPEEPEKPQEPVDPNTEQREACSENCPPCPATSQDVAKLVSNGEGEWAAPEGPWGSWKLSSESPITLTVPLSGTLDWLDYWASKPVSTSVGLVTNVTEASYSCQELPQAPVQPSFVFIPLLSFADEEIFEVPSGPIVDSPWSCFSSNEDAASKLGGDYWNWTPPKESEPWASWLFKSPLPKQVCHPGGDFGGFLEHFSLGRLESGCYPQPIQDASYTCEDVED